MVALCYFFLSFGISTSEKVQQKAYFAYDSGGYYSYLPAFLIYHDPTFSFYKEKFWLPEGQFLRNNEGIMLNKYGMGVAIMQSPFFLVAHLIEKIKGKEASGFSLTYYQATFIGAAFYGAVGLFLLGLFLKNYFKNTAVILTLLALGFGTNLFYYTTFEGMMSHVYSFFLFAAILLMSHKVHETGKVKYFIWIAFIGGLITAVRLTNVVVLMIPFLWGISNFKAWKSIWFLILKKPQYLILAGGLFVLPVLPHFLYLHHMSGSWMLDAYAGERFFWTDPLIWKVLFSFRKGWIIWSPILVSGIIGFIFIRKHPGFWSILIFSVVNLYLVSTWWCWWYGGGFGMRALIEMSAIISLGMAAFFEKAMESQIWKYALIGLFPWFIALNFFQTHQYEKGIIHHDAMTQKAYWEIFGMAHPVSEKVIERRNKYLHYTDPKRTMEDAVYRKGL
jgi:hypothetical protein